MNALWLWPLLLSSTVSELPLAERPPLAVVFRAPALAGETRAASQEALRAALEQHTAFRVEDLSEQVEESDDPLRSVTRAAAAASREGVELTLLVSVLPLPGEAQRQIGWQLVETREAARAIREAYDAGAAFPELGRFVAAFDLFEASAEAPLAARIIEALRPSLEARGSWREHGVIELSLPAEGFSVGLDGRAFPSEERTVRIQDARVGARKLELRHPDFQTHAAEVLVEPGRVTRLEPVLVDRRLDDARVPRAVVFGSGLTLLAAGTAFLVVALAQASAPSPRCLMLPGDPPCATDEAGFARLGPVPTAPLGYSLALGGAVLTGGVLLSEPTDPPWWWTALGLGLGAASFGLSVLLEGAGS